MPVAHTMKKNREKMLEFFYLRDIERHERHFWMRDQNERHLRDITIYGMTSDIIKRSDWLILVPIISVVDSPVCNGKQQVQSG